MKRSESCEAKILAVGATMKNSLHPTTKLLPHSNSVMSNENVKYVFERVLVELRAVLLSACNITLVLKKHSWKHSNQLKRSAVQPGQKSFDTQTRSRHVSRIALQSSIPSGKVVSFRASAHTLQSDPLSWLSKGQQEGYERYNIGYLQQG